MQTSLVAALALVIGSALWTVPAAAADVAVNAPVVQQQAPAKSAAQIKAVAATLPTVSRPALTPLLRNLGNQYTPMTRPGMLGRYDIYGWHKSPAVRVSNIGLTGSCSSARNAKVVSSADGHAKANG